MVALIDVLSALLSLSALLFSITAMLSVGFSYTAQELIGPLQNTRRVIRALIANFVLVPLLALAVTWLLVLDSSLTVGLMLIATGAGAPFLITLTKTAEGEVGRSAALLVLLLPVTILYMPVVIPLLAPEVRISALAIATPLILTMLLPLAVGLIVRAFDTSLAEDLRPIMSKVSGAALVTLVLTTFIMNFEGIMYILWRGALLAALLVIGGAFLIGYLIGGPEHEGRTVLGLGTGQRNVTAAIVVATQAIDDLSTVNIVVVSSLVGLAILFFCARWLRESGRQRPVA